MTSSPHLPPRRAIGLRAVAVVALFSLSCTTVRVPASGLDRSVKVAGDVAEPQVELWLESGKGVSPAEVAQASADARSALAQALATRRLSEGEQLLVVRAQGVSRTTSRRSDQTAAKVGIVVAAVAVVAVVVVALVASQGKGGGGVKAPAAHATPAGGVRPAPAVGGAAHAVPAVVPRPPRPVGTPIAGPPARPAPAPGRYGHGGGSVAVGVDVQLVGPVPQNGPPPAVWADTVEVPPPPPPPALGAEVGEVALPPPLPLEVARRGFFAKDLTRLELTLVDRATGAPLWVKTVEKEIDPRDAGAVRALMDAALDTPGGWEPAAAAP
jgi:hypothetical protein